MLPLISSRQNPLCKWVRSLHSAKGRREHNTFLIEGRNGIKAAQEAGWPLQSLLCVREDVEQWQNTANAQVIQPVTSEILTYLSDAQTAPGVLAIATLPNLSDALPDSLILVLDGVSDPGNVGTLIRSADAAGAGGVLCTATSADPFSPKAVRSSAGSLFHTRILQIADNAAHTIAATLRETTTPIIIADAAGEDSCFDFNWPLRCALVLGHETRGVSEAFRIEATTKLSIPIYGRAESLNVASAGTVMLYAWRQGI